MGTLHSAPLPWLPVLSNIEPPALRRKAATDKLVEKIVKHDSWPIQFDILSPPLLWLTSRKLLWLELQPVDIKSRWRHNWKSAQVVNSHLVCDPTIRQPHFDLPRKQWFLLSYLCMEQGHCGACRRKWRLTDTDLCPCGKTQTMFHIVESCPLTKLNGGLSRLHSADEDAVSWLTSYGSWHTYEKKKMGTKHVVSGNHKNDGCTEAQCLRCVFPVVVHSGLLWVCISEMIHFSMPDECDWMFVTGCRLQSSNTFICVVSSTSIWLSDRSFTVSELCVLEQVSSSTAFVGQ